MKSIFSHWGTKKNKVSSKHVKKFMRSANTFGKGKKGARSDRQRTSVWG